MGLVQASKFTSKLLNSGTFRLRALATLAPSPRNTGVANTASILSVVAGRDHVAAIAAKRDDLYFAFIFGRRLHLGQSFPITC
jgi:hypothetical protein